MYHSQPATPAHASAAPAEITPVVLPVALATEVRPQGVEATVTSMQPHVACYTFAHNNKCRFTLAPASLTISNKTTLIELAKMSGYTPAKIESLHKALLDAHNKGALHITVITDRSSVTKQEDAKHVVQCITDFIIKTPTIGFADVLVLLNGDKEDFAECETIVRKTCESAGMVAKVKKQLLRWSNWS